MPFAKIFKRQKNGELDVELKTYDSVNNKYNALISDMRSENFKQVIINSEIMLMIIEKTLKLNGLLMKIELENDSDVEIIEEINMLVKKIREESNIYFEDLKKILHWTNDNNSIDLKKITIYSSGEKYELYSNGIVINDNNNYDKLYKEILIPVLQRYFL